MTKFVECPVVDNIPLLADVLYTGQMYTFAVPPNNSSGIAMSDILLGQNHIAGMLINNSFGTDSTNEPVPLETLALPAVPIDFFFFKLKRVNVRKWREREREREREQKIIIYLVHMLGHLDNLRYLYPKRHLVRTIRECNNQKLVFSIHLVQL